MASRKIANKRTYLKAPEKEMIQKHIDELGVSVSQYERFFGIPIGTVPQILLGLRELPAKFWHIVYEKIKPAYGVGYFNPNEIPSKKKKSKIATPVPHGTPNSVLLDKLKDNLK